MSSTPPCTATRICSPGWRAASSFTAGRREVGHALAPGGGFFRVAGFEFGPGVALEAAEAALTQACVRVHRLVVPACDGLRGFQRPAEIAGVERVNGFFSQRLRELGRLPAAVFVEVDVGVALDAGVAVPGGFTVAHGQDAGDFQMGVLFGWGGQQGALYRVGPGLQNRTEDAPDRAGNRVLCDTIAA